MESPQGTRVTIAGRDYLSFCSNDYLGLANHPEVVKALCEGARLYGVGSGAAHLVSGHSQAHHELENALAAFTGRERALLFSTGYMANLGVIAALCNKNSVVIEDRLNHASLIDGAQLSHATLRRYTHGEMDSLASRLRQYQGKPTLVATDGVFSMEGDIAPLPAIVELCRQYNALLLVDDAHGLGVLGEDGTGTLDQYGCSGNDVPALVGTLGKAFGTFGAFVAGSADLIEHLIQNARSYLYTTALPPAVAHATLASLCLVERESWRRQRLKELIAHFRHSADALGLTLTDSVTPIQPIILGDNHLAVTVSQKLRQHGVLVTAIRPPTVPVNSARLRITFSANHSIDDVDTLLNALSDAL